jgi:hypothetical protein
MPGSQLNHQHLKTIQKNEGRLSMKTAAFVAFMVSIITAEYRGWHLELVYFCARETCWRNFSMRSPDSLRASAWDLGVMLPLRSASKTTASAATKS